MPSAGAPSPSHFFRREVVSARPRSRSGLNGRASSVRQARWARARAPRGALALSRGKLEGGLGGDLDQQLHEPWRPAALAVRPHLVRPEGRKEIPVGDADAVVAALLTRV